MNMPAGEAQAPSGTVVTPFDSRKIYFEFDRHDLSPDGRQILTEIAAYLKEHGELRLDIEGHCDERGTSEYNLALGERRACAARDFLVTMGIDAARIGTISYGEEKPEDPGKTEEAWSKNRRDQFIFSR
jgi:peptidoglycan-associated lipoprotein